MNRPRAGSSASGIQARSSCKNASGSSIRLKAISGRGDHAHHLARYPPFLSPLSDDSDIDPFDLIERDLVASPVVELGRARAFVRGHSQGVFERAAGLEVGGDAGRPEHVAAELPLKAGLGGTAADHLIGIDAMHWPVGRDSRFSDRRAEEGGPFLIAD